MTFWQLTIDANAPARLAQFWSDALGYEFTPPADTDTTWHAHYRVRLEGAPGFTDRLFDPTGAGPALWFQQVPEAKSGKNRLHIDLYPTGRDDSLPMSRRIEIVDATVDRLVALGAAPARRTGGAADDNFYYVVMTDPEGNEFCVS